MTEALDQLDPRMDNAMSQRDAATLESLLAPDFIYTHSNGLSQPKAEFIAAIVARQDPPRRDLSDICAERHGDILITRGNLDVVYPDGRPTLYFRYVRTWRLLDGRWRLISSRTLYAHDRRPSPSA